MWIIQFLWPGLKLIRGLIWSLESEHGAWATKTQLSPPRDGASNGQSPKTSDFHHRALTISLLRQEQETCQHWEDKKVNNRRGKSQHVEIWDGASVTSGPIVSRRHCLIILGVWTSQTSIVRYSDWRKQLSSGEEDDPSNTENLSHPLQCPSWPHCKHHSQFLLEEQVIPVIIRYPKWHVLFRQKKIF